jgi:hypothetical protein
LFLRGEENQKREEPEKRKTTDALSGVGSPFLAL